MRNQKPPSKFERFLHSDAFWGGLFILFVVMSYIGSYFTKRPVPELAHIMAVGLVLYGVDWLSQRRNKRHTATPP